MRLKALPNRLYNIIFHTHTISGLLISGALYVIFFAGAFSLFKDAYFLWENPGLRKYESVATDFDKIMKSIDNEIEKYDWEDDTFILLGNEERPLAWIFGHIKTEGEGHEHTRIQYHPASDTFYKTENSTIGETLYRLHFLDQIPYAGRYLAGFVSLFFLFATLTGILIHWKNIVQKFTGFSLKGGWKQIWTNSHTVFGLLGLPFQIMYAITGAFYLLAILALAPVVLMYFNGDIEAAFKVIDPLGGVVSPYEAKPAENLFSINELVQQSLADYPDYEPESIQIKAYGREDGILHIALKGHEFLAGTALISYSLKDGSLINEIIPGKNKKYKDSVRNGIDSLHFGNFGGTWLKIVYFLLALITCFIIISGILLWKEARNKKIYPEKEKRFNHKVTIFHLALCFALLPAITVLFCAELLIPYTGENHIFWVRTAFFLSWLIFGVIGLFLKTEIRQVRFYLLLTAIGAFAVPLVNGFATGDWFWVSYAKHLYTVGNIDVCWLMTGFVACGLLYMRAQKNLPKSD